MHAAVLRSGCPSDRLEVEARGGEQRPHLARLLRFGRVGSVEVLARNFLLTIV
jgi:hypothetical protein